jgi:hypothetical protein
VILLTVIGDDEWVVVFYEEWWYSQDSVSKECFGVV